MMKRALALAVAALGLAAAAQAAGHQNDAGCGLGTQIFKENRPVDQILAGTTNNSIVPQSFAITTGTLGCTSGGLIKTAKEREVFTAANFRAIEKEIAAGGGQYTASLAAMTGCKARPFAAFAKTHYEALFPSAATTPDQMLGNLDKTLLGDPGMAKACAL